MQRFAFIFLVLGLLALGLTLGFTPRTAEIAGGKAQIGGPFAAVSHLGQPFTDKDLKGHYSLVYFGFTYCPDICPTALLEIADAMDALPEDLQEKVLPVFVTVDPKRDTPEIMRQYVENFHPRLVGITGTPEQIATVAKAYKVYYSEAPTQSAGEPYLVDHSGYLYLMGPSGQYLAHFPHNVTKQALADALLSHIQ